MSVIRSRSREQFADQLGISDQLESSRETPSPAPWGIARMIRREVRRRGLVTRRDLRKVIEPFLITSGFAGDTKQEIIKVADRMVRVGELAEIKVENQWGYAAKPSCWIRLGSNDAVLLGTTATQTYRFSSFHPNQFLRRFRPTESTVSDLTNIGVAEKSFRNWLDIPHWKLLVQCEEPIETFSEVIEHFVSKIDHEGQPLDLEATKVMAIADQPGAYFGKWRIPQGGRWTSPNRLSEGVYIAAIPGRNDNHWLPALLKIDSREARTLDLNVRNNQAATFELRNWLLIALGAFRSHREVVQIDHENSQMKITFPAPSGVSRIFDLLGEPSSEWQTYDISNVSLAQQLISETIPEVRLD